MVADPTIRFVPESVALLITVIVYLIICVRTASKLVRFRYIRSFKGFDDEGQFSRFTRVLILKRHLRSIRIFLIWTIYGSAATSLYSLSGRWPTPLEAIYHLSYVALAIFFYSNRIKIYSFSIYLGLYFSGLAYSMGMTPLMPTLQNQVKEALNG